MNLRVRGREGFALFSVIMALVVVAALVGASFAATRLEVSSVQSSVSNATGFYSAEAGLNVRSEMIRDVFLGYIRPSGTSPTRDGACEGGNRGSGNFACLTLDFNDRDVVTYVSEDPRNNDPNDSERTVTIPPGEPFAGLSAIQYRYTVVSEARPAGQTLPEAMLEMTFKSRLIPLFQFSAFYNKDLEILPGPDMTLSGPVHVNGDLYMSAGATLTIGGAISVAQHESGLFGGQLWRGRKDSGSCSGTVRVNDADAATNPDPAIPCPRRWVPQAELDAWNGRIQTGLESVTVPAVADFEIGGTYWQQADLVLALDLRSGVGVGQVIVPNRAFGGGIGGITTNNALTAIINNPVLCPGLAPRSYNIRGNPAAGVLPPLPPLPDQRAVEWSNSFRDRREETPPSRRSSYRLMLEVDLIALLDCINDNPSLLSDGPSLEDDLGDTSGGGLAFYLTVLGPFSDDPSSGYGVRIRNGWRLDSTDAAAPDILGLTLVSDQAAWIEGDYNLDGPGGNDWRPASLISDAVNLLSNNFRNQFIQHNNSATNAVDTEMQVAFISGTRTTGNADGPPGQGGPYNGGLENYPIFHERWSGDTLTYLGSFVSLREPLRSSGNWSGAYYSPPRRNWGYDTRFNDVQNLPPLTPRFVYLAQESFVRDFNR